MYDIFVESVSMKYYYLLMSQQDMIQDQVLEELLRERTNYYLSKNKTLDFWINIAPNFIYELKLEEKIKKSNFYVQKKGLISYNNSSDQNFYCALISLDKNFINWIQLRLGYFETVKNSEIESINSNYISDGISGSFVQKDIKEISPLEGNRNFIHPILSIRKQHLLIDVDKKNG